MREVDRCAEGGDSPATPLTFDHHISQHLSPSPGPAVFALLYWFLRNSQLRLLEESLGRRRVEGYFSRTYIELTLSLSFSLSLSEKYSKSSSLHAPTFRSQEGFAVRLEAKVF